MVVTINFDKTAGTCATPTAGDSQLEEIGFTLEAPNGDVATIVSTGFFDGAGQILGVEMVFDSDSGNPLAALSGSAPQTGTFNAENDFVNIIGDPLVSGFWTINAIDTAVGSPLCINSYVLEVSCAVR